eukprot:1161579-Pelagomonas_calceolata.AAC.4
MPAGADVLRPAGFKIARVFGGEGGKSAKRSCDKSFHCMSGISRFAKGLRQAQCQQEPMCSGFIRLTQIHTGGQCARACCMSPWQGREVRDTIVGLNAYLRRPHHGRRAEGPARRQLPAEQPTGP